MGRSPTVVVERSDVCVVINSVLRLRLIVAERLSMVDESS